MGTYRDLCKKIPDEQRKLILERNMISQAIGQNEFMRYLFDVWFMFIDPNGHKDWDCGFCREYVQKNYAELQPTLIELEKEKNLLDAV